MLKKLSAFVTFSTMSIVLALGLFWYFYTEAGWTWYQGWLLAWSISAFLLWWIDHSRKSVPNGVFYFQVVAGGFAGAWLGMFGFWHKIGNKTLWIVLIASTLIHRALMQAMF